MSNIEFMGRLTLPADPQELAKIEAEEAGGIATGKCINFRQWAEMGKPRLRPMIQHAGFWVEDA